MRILSVTGVAVLCALLAQTSAATAKAAKKKSGQDRTGQVIFQDTEPGDLGRTKILKVTVAQELPDALIVDVEYNRAEEFGQDQLELYITPDISLWSVEQVHLLPGKNVVSQGISLQDAAKEPMESRNLSLSIEHYKDHHTLGDVFHRIVPFAKTWRPRR